MKKLTKILLLFFFPCCTFALGLNSYFQQGFEITNNTGQAITASDTNTAISYFQNITIEPNYYSKVTYDSDQFTNPAGQTFTRAVNIYSKNDNKLLCTVTGTLVLGATGSMSLSSVSTDESKCTKTSVMQYSAGHMYLGYEVNVISV